jgi:hypothetical protein
MQIRPHGHWTKIFGERLAMIAPKQRLIRMQKSFEKDKSILFEDYKYFANSVKPHVPTPQSKAARKSAEQSGRQSRERNETPSSDKTDD